MAQSTSLTSLEMCRCFLPHYVSQREPWKCICMWTHTHTDRGNAYVCVYTHIHTRTHTHMRAHVKKTKHTPAKMKIKARRCQGRPRDDRLRKLTENGGQATVWHCKAMMKVWRQRAVIGSSIRAPRLSQQSQPRSISCQSTPTV